MARWRGTVLARPLIDHLRHWPFGQPAATRIGQQRKFDGSPRSSTNHPRLAILCGPVLFAGSCVLVGVVAGTSGLRLEHTFRKSRDGCSLSAYFLRLGDRGHFGSPELLNSLTFVIQWLKRIG